MDRICTNCAHCGMTLSDALSIQVGLGPICRGRGGYKEDPVNSDEMQAMIDLAEYPELVEFLVEHYKPQGVRGLMNGLVKVCALNRKSPVHEVCCEAINSLGYHKLASLLRESLAVVEVTPSKEREGYLNIWVKKSAWTYAFTRSMYQIQGTTRSLKKGTLVPNFDGKSFSWVDGQKVANRKLLWDIIIRHYEGYICKTDKGAFKIKPKAVAV